MADRGIVEYFAEHEGYRCGYCGCSDTNYSHGMWCHQLTVQDYQDLIDRGWRRSGKYSYKPTMHVTCCPHYTIKQKALEFKMSKSQKKAIKRVNNYLNYGKRSGNSEEEESKCQEKQQTSETVQTGKEVIPEGISGSANVGLDLTSSSSNNTNEHDTTAESKAKKTKVMSEPSTCDSNAPSYTQTAELLNSEKKVTKVPRSGDGADASKPPCKKAKQLRRERKLKKQAEKPQADQSAGKSKKGNLSKTLEDFLNDIVAEPAHKLELRLVRSAPRSAVFKSSFDEAYNVYHKYQTAIHNDPPEKPTVRQYTRFLVDSPFADDDDEENFQDDELPQGYGSFHHQYLLDGKIIAVGVIDILPFCVSSVYLYYDPDYSFLSLGTYSALREIALVRELQRLAPKLEYYYMGYYIHSCPKMKYKGNYYPSYLLCPKSYTWHPIEKCRPLLDQNKYSVFDENEKDRDACETVDNVLVLHSRQAMPYFLYRSFNKEANDEAEVKEYAGFVGKTVAHRILLYRK